MVMQAAATIWFVFATVLLLVFVGELGDEPRAGVLLITGTLGLASAWLWRRLTRGPSLSVVVISVCVAAFVVFLWLVAAVEGSGGWPWGLAVPLMAGAAAFLALKSKASSR
jgi:hypothetical protein